MNTTINDTRLSAHFRLNEFLNINKYPDNKPTLQDVVNMTYGCHLLLEPARLEVGPIIINSGFRNSRVNSLVGGVRNSQHLHGQAADIRPADPKQFQRLVEFLRRPTVDGHRLAAHLLESLRPAPPLHPPRLLQILVSRCLAKYVYQILDFFLGSFGILL